MKRIIPFAIFTLFFFIGLWASPRMGASWDEPDNIVAGGVYLNFFTSGFDASILTDHNAKASLYDKRVFTQNPSLERYPPFPLIFGSSVVSVVETVYKTPLTGKEIIQLFHIVSGLFFALFVVSIYYWGRLLGLNRIFALFAALFAGFLPTLFGYGFSTIKDSAQISLFSVSLLLLVLGTVKDQWFYVLLGTVVWAAAFATKFNAIYVPVIWVSWRIVYLWMSQTRLPEIREKVKIVLRMIPVIASVGVVGGICIIIFWPYLWFDPINRFLAVFHYFTSVGSGYKIFWDGQKFLVGAGESRWWYVLGSLLFSTPIVILVLFVSGVFATLHLWLVKREDHDVGPRRSVLFFWLFVPLIRAFFPYSAYYDGIRHFLEILPVLCLFAAMSLQWVSGSGLVEKIGKYIYKRTFFAVAAGVLVVVNVAYVSFSLFPYSYGYLNVFASSKKQDFDRDYAALAIAEGVDAIHQKYPHALALFSPTAGHLSWYYLTGQDMYVYSPEYANAMVLINKPSHISREELESVVGDDFLLLHTIIRGSDVFGWAYVRK